MSFDYFYGPQSEQFTFYRIPKVLFTNEKFWNISTDAKLLYGILLERMNLSAINKWLDDEGRVYIIFTIDDIKAYMGCAEKKAIKMLDELEKKCGLIERKRQGLGKPNLIYVKNFIDSSVDNYVERQFLNCQNDKSGIVKSTTQDLSKEQCNNKEFNNKEINNKDISYLSSESCGKEAEDMNERKIIRNFFIEQLDYSYLEVEPRADVDALQEILELLVDTCCTKRSTVRIAGDDKPTEVVKCQLMKLNSEHIRYVMMCMHNNTSEIKNIKQYLLTSLYNAPMTINHYYSSLVQHDMADDWY